MTWSDLAAPSPMVRVAFVAPTATMRSALEAAAREGSFEPDPLTSEVESVAEHAIRTELTSVAVGWVPRSAVDNLRAAVSTAGASIVELEHPKGVTPPTQYGPGKTASALRPLVTIYATVPYRDLDPTWFAAAIYMLMFGMMFGDVGHGLALAGLGLAAASGKAGRLLSRAAAAAPFLVGAGAASVAFGFAYGEAFGPTGLVPTLWIRPLDEPETLLLAGLVIGGVLMAATFVLSAVNRWREAGPAHSLYAASGIGGAVVFGGVVAAVAGSVSSSPGLTAAGIAALSIGALLVFAGLLAQAGSGSSGLAQATVEMFDTLLRLGSNLVSFTRLAAFGLTHAVISGVVWEGTTSIWSGGSAPGRIAAVVLFGVGNIAAFALGALVGAIQALRLEYYELFSRLFDREGRPFHPLSHAAERSELQ